MIRIASQPTTTVPAWHAVFVKMIPAITRHAKIAFRYLSPEAREEAIQEVICNACTAVARLAELGKLDLAFPSVLARYGFAQFRDGRKVGCKLNVRDVLSRHCQQRKNLTVERLDRFDDEEGCWKEAVVQDTRSAPVPDIVAFRLDFPAWLGTLNRRNRRITLALATNERTSRVARKFHVSAGRISQLRTELKQGWEQFQGEQPSPALI
jgi:hypothetical protein